MLTEELVQGAQKYLMDTYARYPLALARGQGTRVYDVEGREDLDFLAGVAVNVLGHCHSKVTQVLQQRGGGEQSGDQGGGALGACKRRRGPLRDRLDAELVPWEHDRHADGNR